MNIDLARQMYPNSEDVETKPLEFLGVDLFEALTITQKLHTLTNGKIALITNQNTGEARVFYVGAGCDHYVCDYVNYETRTILKTIVYID